MALDGEVRALREAAGALPRPEVSTLVLTGPDRQRYLNGMVSGNVARLQPGDGLLAVKPNGRGRVEAVVRVRAGEEALFLDLAAVVATQVQRSLEQLIIMDDCALADGTGGREVLGVCGPAAAEVLARAGLEGAAALAEHGSRSFGEVTVIRDRGFGVDGFELHVPAGGAGAMLERLAAAGAARVSAEALEVLRVEAGVPRDGAELDDDVIPLEARLEPILDFTKGCYVGQEVIARAHNLGGVKHILVGVKVTGEVVPPLGAELFAASAADKVTGELTSAVRSPALGVIGLGYVRRAHEAPGTALVVLWPEGRAEAEVAELPFVR